MAGVLPPLAVEHGRHLQLGEPGKRGEQAENKKCHRYGMAADISGSNFEKSITDMAADIKGVKLLTQIFIRLTFCN